MYPFMTLDDDTEIVHSEAMDGDGGFANAFIDDTPYLTDLQCQFYKTYLAARYDVLFKSF